MKLLVAAIAFLTRVPTPARWEFDAADVGRASRWFPLVGALIGITYYLAFRGLSPFFPPLVVGTLIVAVEALLTGALHLDGLADMADGFGGGRSREDVLRIMRDHAIGSYGSVALILLVLLKITATASLIEHNALGPYLFIAPVLSRWATVFLNCLLPYARRSNTEGSKPGGAVTDFVGRRELVIATLISSLIVFPFLGRRGIICWVAVIAVSSVSAGVGWGRIGGVTGDTLGANTEICEATVLLVALALG